MKQYTLLTASGINKLLKTASDGSKIALKEVVVSDYDGELSEQTTSIPNEKYRGAINAVTIDESDSNILDVDAVIPPEVGGFYIKTAGIYCDDGSLFAVARLADTYKPLLNEGSSKDITLNFKLQIANASESIILKVDNNIVLATRKWCEKMFLKLKDKIDAYTKKESDNKFALKDNLPDLATDEKAGITKLKNAITAKQEDAAVTEKAVSDAIEANKGIGVGQTWQDVKKNRKLNINYTNDTTKPIFIIVGRRGDGSPYPLKVFVSGVLVYEGRTNHNAIGVNKVASVVVPVGKTYKVEMSGIDLQTDEQFQWVELR
nr:MAG TPA: tail collar fiber protein [Caudoviricetes sp.]